MTRAEEIRELFEYNRWANHRILDGAATLDDDALTRDLGSSFPSVLATLVHIMGADWVWMRRWRGESPASAPAEWDTSSLPAVRARWDAIQADRDILLATLDDAGLEREITYRKMDGSEHTNRLGAVLRHVVNHSTYHRGQIVTMLRQLGATPPATDLIVFYRQRAAAG